MDHELTASDFRSETWKRFTKALRKELERLRELNDAQRDVVGTAATRGQIAAVKQILALAPQASASDSRQPGTFPVDTFVELRELGIDPHELT